MEHLNPNEKEKLKALLGGRDDYLQLLMILIRDHDEFGVLSTGEASYPILLRAANSVGNYKDDQKRLISAIMWLNLADMAGTPGLDLRSNDIRKIVTDWGWFLDAINKYDEKDKEESLHEYVIRKASDEDLVIRRIARLLIESSRSVSNRFAKFQKDENGERAVMGLVRAQLQTVYPTSIPRHEFCSELTHVCKMDYGKRFFACLVEYCEGQKTENIGGQEKTWFDRRGSAYKETEDLVYAVLAILRRISSTYSAMMTSHSGGKTGNLIGVEMKDLTPKNAPEKTAQIIELLLKNHYSGLSWMMSDCLAWYF
jgi:hypothetical protein